jgi:hypothetical protein
MRTTRLNEHRPLAKILPGRFGPITWRPRASHIVIGSTAIWKLTASNRPTTDTSLNG